MFNRTIMAAPTQRVAEHVHVTERRAPTDESVRLLKEFEEKAESRRIDAIKVGDTTFECVIHSERDHASGDAVWWATFSLNGKKLQAQHRAQYDALDAKQEHIVALRDAIAREIATHVLAQAIDRMPIMIR